MDTFSTTYGTWIMEYGYWAMILGALIEGEGILLLAGAAAYMGYFSLPLVMLVSFIGAIIHDQLLYGLGRIGGITLLHRYSFLQKKANRAFKLLKKYDYWLIMGFRFVYGIRTITPLALGASDISFKRYSLLTISSAFIWACTVSAGGYFLANVIDSIIQAFDTYKIYVIIVPFLLIAFIISCAYLFKKKKRKKITLSSQPRDPQK